MASLLVPAGPSLAENSSFRRSSFQRAEQNSLPREMPLELRAFALGLREIQMRLIFTRVPFGAPMLPASAGNVSLGESSWQRT